MGSIPLRQLRAASNVLKGEQLIAHNLIVGGGTFGAGFLGVAFQVVVSHRLHPTDYGGVFAVMTLLTLIALPSSAFTLLMARTTSQGRARSVEDASASLLRHGSSTLFAAGVALAILVAITSPLTAAFLAIPVQQVLLAAVSIPFAIVLSLLIGELQGQQRFVAFSIISAGQAALKLVAAVALGIFFGPLGVIGGITLASLAACAAAVWSVRPRLSFHSHAPWLRAAGAYLAMALPSSLALSLLLSADVLLVKHYFPSRGAGEYSAVAAIGRAIFWGASGVAAVLFPKVAFRAGQGRPGGHLITASLMLVMLGGLGTLAALWIASSFVLSAFAGAAYAEAAAYLPAYAVGMTLLGMTAVLIATHQSRGRSAFLAILLPLTALEPILIAAFHQSLFQVVWSVDASMALLVAGLGGLLVYELRSEPEVDAVPAALLTGAVQTLRVNR